jgi:DNA uptake protein ComE-like DNA-binding protein
MKAFLAGLGIGAAFGLLVAPQEGAKTRADIAQQANDFFDRYRDQKQPQPLSVNQELPESTSVADVLNTASKNELMSVDGIGKGTAKRIIQNRPYETIEEVVQEGVVEKEILERVKEQLIEKPAV